MQALFPPVPGGVPNPGTDLLTKPAQFAAALAAPFHPADVEWRPGGGGRGDTAMPMAYIDARAVRQRLNAVCGVAGWQCQHYAIGEAQMGCAIAIWSAGQWVVKTDGAFAGFLDPVVEEGKPAGKVSGKEEQRIEMEAKGAFSNAFKRAAAAWGIGEYLYEVKPSWMPVEKNQSGFVKGFTEEAKRKLWDIAMDHWARYQIDLALREERRARRLAGSQDTGALDQAIEAAVRCARIRHEILGDGHDDTKRAIHLRDELVARKDGKAPPVAPSVQGAGVGATGGAGAGNGTTTSANEPLPAGATMGSATTGGAAEPSIKVAVDRLDAAGSADEVKAAVQPFWTTWAADSQEGIALRSALEKNMQRFLPGWTIAGAAAQKAQQSGAPTSNGGAQGARATKGGGARQKAARQ